MQVKSCVDLSNFSSSSSRGNTTRIGSEVLCLCGSTDQKAYFLPNLLPSTDRKYTPTDWTLDRKFTVKRCTIYLMASDMIEEMLLQEGINKRKKWMKKDLKQFTPDVKCLYSFLIMI